MLRKPRHKLEKALFLLFFILLFSGIALALMNFVVVSVLSFVSSLYLLLALFTYVNLSKWRKSRNTEKEMDVVGLSPDQVYDVLVSFFSKKHGFNKMQVLHSSKPALIIVKLNSWIGMGRAFNRPPGVVKLQVSPSDRGSKIQFEFDFSGFRNFIYTLADVVLLMLFVLGWPNYGLLSIVGKLPYPMSFLWVALFLLILFPQIPFASALEVKMYLRHKIRECLTQYSRKSS